MDELTTEILQVAAALVVEEGMELGPAKQHALKQLRLKPSTPLPNNQALEAAIREYIDIFHAEEQPVQLAHLRQLALQWMERLSEFSPLLSGTVWSGTATQHSNLHLQLFHDDIKALPIWLLNANMTYDGQEARGLHGNTTEVFVLHTPAPADWPHAIGICLWNNPTEALRGALQTDGQGESACGTPEALRQRMAQSTQ